MAMEWEELGETFRNDVFATWFGWFICLAVIIFPMTSMIGSCYSDAVREDIVMAEIAAKQGDRGADQRDLMQWMVGRGVHPLVARCAIFNAPQIQCAALMADLKPEERETVIALLSAPVVEVAAGKFEVMEVAPGDYQSDFADSLDFGANFPVKPY